MTDGSNVNQPPGWYDDPTDELYVRYWDGQSWTTSQMLRSEILSGADANVFNQKKHRSPGMQVLVILGWIAFGLIAAFAIVFVACLIMIRGSGV